MQKNLYYLPTYPIFSDRYRKQTNKKFGPNKLLKTGLSEYNKTKKWALSLHNPFDNKVKLVLRISYSQDERGVIRIIMAAYKVNL